MRFLSTNKDRHRHISMSKIKFVFLVSRYVETFQLLVLARNIIFLKIIYLFIGIFYLGAEVSVKHRTMFVKLRN